MKLHIPTPCHEDWQKMTPSEKGRFCQSCQTEVQDFTRLSDREILARVLQNSGKSLCGHFRKDQLGRKLHTPRKPIAWPKWFFGGMAALFASQPLSAQTKNENAAPVVQMRPVADRLQVKQNETVRYMGQVLDQKSGVPIIDVKIEIRVSDSITYSATTNPRGNFTLTFPRPKNTVAVKVNAHGYLPYELTVDFAAASQSSRIFLTALEGDSWISGTVTDAEEKERIPFVHIAIAGIAAGTQTDIEGRFKIYIPDSLRSSSLIFSAVGYEQKVAPISPELFKEPLHQQIAQLTTGGISYERNLFQSAWWRVKGFFRFRWLRRGY